MSFVLSTNPIPSPAPRIHTGVVRVLLATSSETMTTAPPPSEIMQQSSRCSGSAIIFPLTTSSTVISPMSRKRRSVMARTASGLRIACARVVTEISASCSGVVPYWCMWRLATIP